jgi:hypothetical protein
MLEVTTKRLLFLVSFFRVFATRRDVFKGELQPLMVPKVTINFIDAKPEEHKSIVEKAGLEAEYRFLKTP